MCEIAVASFIAGRALCLVCHLEPVSLADNPCQRSGSDPLALVTIDSLFYSSLISILVI